MRRARLSGRQVNARRVKYDPISRDYRAARGLPPETLALWHNALAPFLTAATAPTVLDLGSGTGRFCGLLSTLCRRVVAVEPSPGMRGEAAKQSFSTEI
jgi:SAM-dependent methyltransferase